MLSDNREDVANKAQRLAVTLRCLLLRDVSLQTGGISNSYIATTKLAAYAVFWRSVEFLNNKWQSKLAALVKNRFEIFENEWYTIEDCSAMLRK